MKTRTNQQAIIITGGPGTGKTSIIGNLEKTGYLCMPESGRQIIQAELRSGGNKLPWDDREAYALEMFRMAMDDYARALKKKAVTFFDRGIPDVIGYLILCELPVPAEIWSAAKANRYNRQVFVTPPWREIYVNDDERKQSFDEAKATCEAMLNIYANLGYATIEIPKTPVKQRTGFILNHIKNGE